MVNTDAAVFMRSYLGRHCYGIVCRAQNKLPETMADAGIRYWLVSITPIGWASVSVVQICIKEKDEKRFAEIITNYERQQRLARDINPAYWDLVSQLHIEVDGEKEEYSKMNLLKKALYKLKHLFFMTRNIVWLNIFTKMRLRLGL